MIRKLVEKFFNLDIIKDYKIQLHQENSITEINVEQFLVILEIIFIENIIFRSNLITNLLKNEIKKITIEVNFNKNIENRRNIKVIKNFKGRKKEVGYINVENLNKFNITILSLDIPEIEYLFHNLLMYLDIIGVIKEETT